MAQKNKLNKVLATHTVLTSKIIVLIYLQDCLKFRKKTQNITSKYYTILSKCSIILQTYTPFFSVPGLSSLSFSSLTSRCQHIIIRSIVKQETIPTIPPLCSALSLDRSSASKATSASPCSSLAFFFSLLSQGLCSLTTPFFYMNT